jgi:hypothetical protein
MGARPAGCGAINIEETRMRGLVPDTVRTTRRVGCALGAALLLAVSGCTSSEGGGGGGDVAIGGGQATDPVVLDFPIAYVKRPVPAAGTPQPDARRLLDFQPGADLFVRDRASPSAADRNVTAEITQGAGDVRDVEPSFDGTKLVFALREPLIEGADEEDQPTWNIWEYEVTTRQLRRVIDSDIVAEEGHDVAPHYLPDGRIVFSSTRQRQSRAILLDEGKPQFAAQDEDRREPAFVLHVVSADGSGLRQISFNQSHDLDPAVLDDGRIVFSRWENAGPNNEINLYTVRPDGSQLELLYGAQSHATGTDDSEIHFLGPRQAANGRLLVRAQPFRAVDLGGQLLEIDVANYVENTQPTLPNIGALGGPAQAPATANDVRTIEGPSPGGRYGAAFPLLDGTGRLLVSWTQCRLVEVERIVPCTDDRLASGTAVPATPLYGVWMYDPRQQTQLPVVAPAEGVIVTDVVAMQPRALPPVLLDRVAGVDFDADLESEAVGILDIRSVYDIDGVDTAPGGIIALSDPRLATAAERPARFLRIEKPVSLPDDDVRDFDNSAFGVTAAFGMREILGYAPIEPDGSVRVKVPADVPFAITVLDADGRRISQRHENWLQVRAGQELKCHGCHDRDSGQSHGRSDLFAAAYDGAQVTGLPFPNTNAALFADFGETMAQTRARISCQTDCAALALAADLTFEDIWTDPVAAGRATDAAFSYRYADLDTPAPTSADCLTNWRAQCRVTIHYEAHIHPLWSKPRITLADDGVTVLADDTCTSCHADRDAAGVPQVPPGQLELTDGPSSDQPDHKHAYRELLAGDNEQELVGGVLQDRLVQVGIDPVTGEPQFEPVRVPASMSAGNARGSVRFFAKFGPGGTHEGRLTPAELKLVSEWLDVGAQYFNDPFAAPLD